MSQATKANPREVLEHIAWQHAQHKRKERKESMLPYLVVSGLTLAIMIIGGFLIHAHADGARAGLEWSSKEGQALYSGHTHPGGHASDGHSSRELICKIEVNLEGGDK